MFYSDTIQSQIAFINLNLAFTHSDTIVGKAGLTSANNRFYSFRGRQYDIAIFLMNCTRGKKNEYLNSISFFWGNTI